jgi:hypothetical protein
MRGRARLQQRDEGQMLVLFALALPVILLVVALVLEGGNALIQRRGAQNASDFGALAGARVIAEWIDGDTNNGSDGNVRTAIANAVTSNGGDAVAFGSPDGPRYIADDGSLLDYVGGGGIPTGAVGVQVVSNRSWHPYILSFVGITTGKASATATAKGGFSLAGPLPGSLFPAGIAQAFFSTFPFCSGPISAVPSDPCYPQHLTPGNLNVPGGFGWLKFGCDGYGLGQVPPENIGGCRSDRPFLDLEIGPPSESFGCCTQVGLAGSIDRIGSLEGNKVSADCSYYIDNQITVTVPIWDTAGGVGNGGWYHIIGFSGFQLTACTGGKDIEGVWRKPFFTGPTTSTKPTTGVPVALGVQLIK